MAERNVEGWGADRDMAARPGVPMELPPQPVGGAHWEEPAQQAPDVPVFKHKGLKALTPVFGTAAPPRGLSGVIRKVAYEVPTHRTKHWLLLMLADRVDVMERMVARFPAIIPAALAGGVLARKLSRAR
ncbi:MAG TPA: hypothetical protein VK447_06115 [Myxococcaceae bacterium]|nr:hypothetical protein [Myxococcaceae bacterium]